MAYYKYNPTTGELELIGTTDYNDLSNKPRINNIPLSGNKTTTDLGLFDGDYNHLKNKPAIPSGQVQSDWAQADTDAVDYIKNKPSIPSGQVQSDWGQTNSAEIDYIKNKPTLGTASAKDVPVSGNASPSQVVLGDDTRLTDSRNAADVYSWAKAATKPTYNAAEVGAIASTDKGANGGVAELDSSGKVPAAQLPSYVDDVKDGYLYNGSFYVESTHETLITPESGKIYIDLTVTPAKSYRWTGSVYAEVIGGASNYNDLTNRPSINGTTLSGNKSSSDLGLMASGAVVANPTGSTTDTLSSLEVNGTKYSLAAGGVSDYADLTGKPQINSVELSGNKSLSDLGIQSALTFDNVPTDGSNNPVKSDGVYDSEKDIYAVIGKMGAKNLIPYPYYESDHTESGITWTVNSDGSITANGTATANSTFILRYRAEQTKFVEKNTSYILSGCPSGGSNSTYSMALFVKNQDDSNIASGFDYGDGITINMPNNDYYGIYAFARVFSGQTVSNLTFKPMLRLASDTDDTYQPYVKTNKQLTDEMPQIEANPAGTASTDLTKLGINNVVYNISGGGGSSYIELSYNATLAYLNGSSTTDLGDPTITYADTIARLEGSSS